jgi:hypothetical protein
MLDGMRGTVPPSPPEPDAVRWRVSPALPGLKLAGTAVIALLGLAFGDDAFRVGLAAAAAVGLAAWAVRDLVAPVRLAADAAGLTVISGYAGRRALPWERIERIRVDVRPRLGLRTETLEIDAGETLHLFSAHDLGAPPAEVAARLAEFAGPRLPPRARSAGQRPGGGEQQE